MSSSRYLLFMEAFLYHLDKMNFDESMISKARIDLAKKQKKKYINLRSMGVNGMQYGITVDTEQKGWEGWNIRCSLNGWGICGGDLPNSWSGEQTQRSALAVANLFADLVNDNIGLVFHISDPDTTGIFKFENEYSKCTMFYSYENNQFTFLTLKLMGDWTTENATTHWLDPDDKVKFIDINTKYTHCLGNGPRKPSQDSIDLLSQDGSYLITSIEPDMKVNDLKDVKPLKLRIYLKQQEN